MAEKLIKYFRLYNKNENFFSRPYTQKEISTQFEMALLLTPEHGRISFEIFPILLTKRQYENKEYFKDN